MLKFFRVIVFLSLLVLLTGCVNIAVNIEPDIDFTDSEGNAVSVEFNPKKVAVLFSSFADVWNIAGGEVSVTVGESVERGFVKETATLVDSGAGKSIDVELLIASEPDFVICSADIKAQTETAKILKEAGIPCALFRVDSFDDYLGMLKICTDITGNDDAYKQYGLEVKKEIDKIVESSNFTDKRILFIRSGSSAASAKAKNAGQHFAAHMLKQLGAYNIAENASVLLDGLSIEEILIEDPDYIFISTMGDESAAKAYMDSVLSNSTWQSLTAVKNKKYVYLPKNLFQFKPNSKWGEAYKYLFDILNDEK